MTSELQPEDLVRRVVNELADHNTFNGNFDDVPLAMLLRFLKCPRDGIRALLIDLKMSQFFPAYEIAIYEVALAIEQKIAVEPSWIETLRAVGEWGAVGSLRGWGQLRDIREFLKKLPVWSGMDIDG